MGVLLLAICFNLTRDAVRALRNNVTVRALGLSNRAQTTGTKKPTICRLFLIGMVGRARFKRATIALKVRLRLILKTAYNL